ncbi:MAG: hypothetical protein B7Z55_05390, partial [Planctomycetales bacterium 12-60-4]
LRWSTFVVHLLSYPPSVVVGCLAPWSLFYLGIVDRDIRLQIGARRDMLTFLAVSIVICFPSVWIPPESRPRYFMPLFPCLAIVVGIMAELLIEVANAGAVRLWTVFVRLGSGVMLAAAVGLTAWAVFGSGVKTPPLVPTLCYGVLATALGVAMAKVERMPTRGSLTTGATLMTAFLGISYVGPVITNQQQRSENVPAAVAALREQLPTDVSLVSFDHLHHLFLHYYGQPVTLLDWPMARSEVPASAEYFGVQAGGTETPELPFAWEEIASVSMDRNHHEIPEQRIVIGRILNEDVASTANKLFHPAVLATASSVRRESLQR